MQPYRPGEVQYIQAVAVHEAAHAVIGRVLGLECAETAIFEACTDGGVGISRTHPVETTLAAWAAKGKRRKRASVYRAMIMAAMAGEIAEDDIVGPCPRATADGDR